MLFQVKLEKDNYKKASKNLVSYNPALDIIIKK